MSVNASLSSSFDNLKTEVGKFAEVYDWNSASQIIENFLKSNVEGDKRVFELLGDSYYNLAFQQNSRDEFKKVILRAKNAYEKLANDNRCKARASFCKYWASDNPDERRAIINAECLPSARELVSQLDASEKDEAILARGYVELPECLTVACSISSDRKQLVELVKEAKTRGRNAFNRFKASSNSETVITVANSYSRFLTWAAGFFIYSEETKQIQDEIIPLSDTLVTLAEGIVEDSRLKSLAYEAAGIFEFEFKGDALGASLLFERAVKESEKTRDNFVAGRQFYLLGYSLIWASFGKDIIEERKEFLEKSIESLSRATESLRAPVAGYELESSYAFFIASSIHLSRDSTNASQKLRYLDRAIDAGKEGLQYSGFSPLSSVDSFLGRALTYKAELLTENKVERARLLSEAVNLTRNGLLQREALAEPDSWNVGVDYGAVGLARARLADEKTESNEETERMSLLKDSVADLKKSVDISIKAMPASGSTTGNLQQIGFRSEQLGDTVAKLYNLSKRKEDCLLAIRAYDESSNYYTQANTIGYLPPITWETAKLYDSIQEYAKSSTAFAKASQQYQSASANQKSLQKSFTDLSQYMQAWSKIEDARLSQLEEDYVSSSERLKEAASLLAKTESFQFLSKHYEAYSAMEQAEDYSHKEKNQEASESFGLASDLYAQAEQDAAKHGKEADDLNWATISKNRGNYCLARKAMEDAKILDRNAQPEASMRRYRAASDTLKEIIGAAKQQQDVSDVEALALSCDAFGTMKEAEDRSSPELYAKASELFMRTKDNPSVKHTFVLSCLANSAICEAFAAGTRFKKTSDVNLYSEIKTKLGIASRYYEEAGFEIASDWTSATEALFDALAYLAGAERELDSAKKTQMYHLAEKHLELSARKYGDIGYDKKRQEVLRQLKKARENRELLISPMEALSQSPTVSSSPVNFTRDQAVGLERFEVANLTGNISLSTKQTNVGSSFRIDIDIANVGKTPALLMKLDGLAPSHSFEAEPEKNSHHFLEGGTSIGVDLKGKRLEYLKAHEMSLYFIAKNKGNYEIKPKVLFVDELGKYRSYEFEPQTVEVRELGFMGWAKGK